MVAEAHGASKNAAARKIGAATPSAAALNCTVKHSIYLERPSSPGDSGSRPRVRS